MVLNKNAMTGEKINKSNETLSLAGRNDSRPFFQGFVQPKLSINQPNDVYEQEADAVADKVMRMGDNAAQNFFFKPSISSLQRKCAHCEEEEKKAQRKEDGAGETMAGTSTENYISTLSGKGRT